MRFVAGGDCLFSSRNLVNRLEPEIVTLLQEADGVFVNAEFTTPKPDIHPPASGRGYVTAVRDSILDEFADLNIRLISFANNHTTDFGVDSVVNTIVESEKRKLLPCGIGRSIGEAVHPKFLDTANGRIGVTATSSTRSEMMLASKAGAFTIARPGVAPLRWNNTYVLPKNLFDNLREIDEALGTAKAFRECNSIEIKKPFTETFFKFGSLFEGNLDFELGEKPYIKTQYNEKDAKELLKSVKDASFRSDFNFVSLHTHEGDNGNWYDPLPADFIQKFAKESIDNGADTVIGHGAHFMRGIEIYKGKPIFYNLGSFLMEFETGESIITPEMYQTYGFEDTSRPSDLHRNRAKDATGKFQGFNSQPRFSRNCLVVFDTEGKDSLLKFKILPIDLDLTRDRIVDRGFPKLVSDKIGKEIAEYLTEVSKIWGTKLEYKEDGYIYIV